jgi:hypothetical protein
LRSLPPPPPPPLPLLLLERAATIHTQGQDFLLASRRE